MRFKARQIGQTKIYVSSVAFGCASIGNLYQKVTEAEARTVLETAWAEGIRYFDTAPHYGRGRSEQRLGTFLSGKMRDDYVVSTKVGRVLSAGTQLAEADSYVDPLPNDVRYDYSGDGIEAALEGSRTRLGTNYIDIVYVHDIGRYTHGARNAAHMEAFLGDGYERLVRLKEKGQIGAIGLGVNENEVCIEIMKDHPLDVILLAGRLTLLDRSAEETLLPMCRDANTSLVLGGVFNSGILATGPVAGATYDYAPASEEVLAAVSELQAKAESLGIPIASAALQFAMCNPLSASVLLGTAKASSLMRNLAALEEVPPEGFNSTFSV